jgi:hypothetical protein
MSTTKKKRTRHLSIRLAAAELEQLEKHAAGEKLGVATWARRALLLVVESAELARRRVASSAELVTAAPIAPASDLRLSSSRPAPARRAARTRRRAS